MATTKVSLKLLIDTKANKVLFAEAGKDFIDFLFGLLSLPVGCVIKRLKGRNSIGCLENVYQSLENLNKSYLQPNLSKGILLNPKVSASVNDIPLLRASSNDSKTTKKIYFYLCNNCRVHVANAPTVLCPRCKTQMAGQLTYVANNAAVSTNPKGYVQSLVMYMVSDDLSVTPMSMISGVQLMHELKIFRFSVLEERVVEVGMDEGIELLRASFQSEAALTAVFLGKKGVNGKHKISGADTERKTRSRCY